MKCAWSKIERPTKWYGHLLANRLPFGVGILLPRNLWPEQQQ